MGNTQRDTVLALPSDTHSGSSVGLMPPGQWAFTNGGYHDPDETQRTMTNLWVEGWKKVRQARKGKRLVIVHAGDATEGIHHGSTQVITPRVDEQERMHTEAMEQALDLAGFDARKGDLLYYVKGTPAHVDQGGQSEERIARQFEGSGVVPMTAPSEPEGKDGRYLWDRLLLEINGRLFDIAHHGAGLGMKPWTRTNPLRSKLQEVYFRSLEEGRRCPDVWVRAHRHIAARDVYVTKSGRTIEGYITPAFQSRTEYGYRVGADLAASMGLLYFEIGAGGAILPRWEMLERDPDEVIRL